MTGRDALPILVFSQGDPAGIGPEILLKALLDGDGSAPDAAARGARPEATRPARDGARFAPLLVIERPAVDGLRRVLPALDWPRLLFAAGPPEASEVRAAAARGAVLAFDPSATAAPRVVVPGISSPADARAAMVALDWAAAFVGGAGGGRARDRALVTAPVAKASIAAAGWPGFRGHTEYLAEAAGLERYGRDYLMAFLAPGLQVALLSVHEPLRRALERLDGSALLDALRCLERGAGARGAGRIAVAGLNPHAGEGGLLGEEDERIVRPAVERALAEGIDVRGPESADSLFARARGGEFDWVLALYHDQGLIAVKTAAFGLATNWTLGLPYLRTSVDHGTAFSIAGRGIADERPLRAVIETTLALLDGTLPRRAGDADRDRAAAG